MFVLKNILSLHCLKNIENHFIGGLSNSFDLKGVSVAIVVMAFACFLWALSKRENPLFNCLKNIENGKNYSRIGKSFQSFRRILRNVRGVKFISVYGFALVGRYVKSLSFGRAIVQCKQEIRVLFSYFYNYRLSAKRYFFALNSLLLVYHFFKAVDCIHLQSSAFVF